MIERVIRIIQTLVLLFLGAMASPAAASERWITHPALQTADPRKPTALQFRREVELKRVPAQMLVRVSADNRYVLFVNGRRAGAGPARGDLSHWRTRLIDLAPYLRVGRNVIAAQVWNDGAVSGLSQISAKTGFILTVAEIPLGELIDTGPEWRVRIDGSRSVTSGPAQLAKAVGPGKYYAASPPETHDAALRRDDWLAAATTASDWVASVDAVLPSQTIPWTLVEDRLPPMRYQPLSAGHLVRGEGVGASRFPKAPIDHPCKQQCDVADRCGSAASRLPVADR